MKLFQYAAILVPNSEDSREAPEIVVPVTDVLAKDEATARVIAARAIPSGYDEDLADIQILVRSF